MSIRERLNRSLLAENLTFTLGFVSLMVQFDAAIFVFDTAPVTSALMATFAFANTALYVAACVRVASGRSQ